MPMMAVLGALLMTPLEMMILRPTMHFCTMMMWPLHRYVSFLDFVTFLYFVDIATWWAKYVCIILPLGRLGLYFDIASR